MVVWVKMSRTRRYPSTSISEGHVAVCSSESTYHISGVCCLTFLPLAPTFQGAHCQKHGHCMIYHRRDGFKRCSQLRILIFKKFSP